ncbi:hypothetical protein JRG42_05685 [Pseudomonas granadensis]|uniref:Uncharacterized protein n=1 Tax=Pseudomonas granadensis TaxID=1421430 RepID=A0ABX7GHL8_9PSED|nr:hypothetical protein [Pseudomonas granadensis]MBN6772859.1 hypothetical protein [Pseudomonas granadensis]MBN6803955.1 hypothetical protein [Pseudomonas granadensis]MBN6830634.1 hypothetical protein [Pseudomonas granadensis]MBN6838176.1 hypothetical protein [Pseudomonas granadensis]MBN6867538.1 hypothetical protein [Pseudomonas granadensis]
MPIKPSVRGSTTASVHGTRVSDSVPGPVNRNPFGGTLAPPSPARRPSSPTDPIHPVITPVPPRVAVSATANSAPAPALPERPLKDYWITSLAVLPAPDAQGISIYRGRQYVEVSDGAYVQIGMDPASGLYRAKLSSELIPSGPVLKPGVDSSLWYPVERLVPLTYPLSTTRLEAFRTDLDFSTADPGSDGLYRFNGKLYARIEQHAYQVLHDLDASSPQRSVMRIVRPGDAVATDAGNLYVASRPGSSEPVAFDSRHGWQGTIVYGAAGMPRTVAESSSAFWQRLEVASELDQINLRVQKAHEKRQELIAAWLTAKDLEAEPATRVAGELKALVTRELHSHQELKSLGKALKYYKEQKSVINTLISEEGYRTKMIALQKGQMLAYQQLIECGLSRRALDGPLLDLAPDRLPRTVSFLYRLMGHLKERQLIADNLVKKWKVSPNDLSDILTSADTHNVVASWVLTKSVLLDNPLSVGNAVQASDLAVQFGMATVVYAALGKIPEDLHVSVLSGLSQQCAALRDWYDRLDLPAGPEHVTSRNDINAEIQAFEHTLETRLTRLYLDQPDGSARPAPDQPIDFDYIPPQDRSGPQTKPWRLFRAKKNGVSKINIGESRRTALGEEVIDVSSPFDPKQPIQTYEHREGEWRPVQTIRKKPLPALLAKADRLLRKSESHVNTALREEQKKYNPDNIVEALERKVGALDDTALQLQRFEHSDANAKALVQRLKQDSQRLRTTGEDIRIRIYKDKNFLCVDRVIYLIDREHVRARKTATRLKRGKGQDREYLDIYVLTDAHTGASLWHAHFHYPAVDTPAPNFKVRGGHLKTLEQSAKGSMSQRREEQAGRPHVAIWRPDFDKRTAQRIFDLAATP